VWLSLNTLTRAIVLPLAPMERTQTRNMMKLIGRLSVISAVVVAAVAPPAARASSCPPGELTRTFRPWLDFKWYKPAPDGGFEAGSADWALTGGAHVVEGNEPFDVRSTDDHRSLALPAGATATTAPVCIDLDQRSLRFFATNTGDPASRLAVSVVVRGPNGQPASLDSAQLAAAPAWAPTPVITIPANVVALISGHPAVFRFAPADSLGDWRIDDVYVDPYGKR
jgi:hypothetical protein